MPTAYYKSQDKNFTLLQGDCIELLNSFDFKFDMIFADPPYHLSQIRHIIFPTAGLAYRVEFLSL